MQHSSASSCPTRITHDGFAILPAVFSPDEAAAIAADLSAALEANSDAAMRSESGTVYAARNIVSLWPPAATVWRRAALLDLLSAVLGPGLGLVRTLYFDKPPERTWALPWHKDLTIAVKDNRLPSAHFTKPTRKAGVPHVEASPEVLEQMVFARIHLDDATAENGPLQVVPGSHRTGKTLAIGSTPPVNILAKAGDVLLIRPLVAHASGRSHPDCRRHRRVLHLEFAAKGELPDGYEWHDFVPGSGS
jgi:hypothetical protein